MGEPHSELRVGRISDRRSATRIADTGRLPDSNLTYSAAQVQLVLALFLNILHQGATDAKDETDATDQKAAFAVDGVCQLEPLRHTHRRPSGGYDN